MRIALLLTAFLAACQTSTLSTELVSTSTVTESSDVPIQAPGWYEIVATGRDQTAQIQKVLDAAAARGYGHILFRPGPQSGLIKLSRQDPYPYALKWKGAANVTWECQGGVTFKRVSADQGAKDRDFATLWVEDSHDLRFEGCTWDGGLREFLQGEQSHIIDLRANKAEVFNVWVTDNDFAWYEGDAVRLLGNAAEDGPLVRDVFIDRNSMHDNQRSGVGVQRAVQRIHITNNKCWNCSDQCIDFEPSGKESEPVMDIVISGNWFGDNVSLALTIAGTKRQPDIEKRAARRILVEGNMFLGGVNVIWARDVIVRGNYIRTRGDKSPAILVNGEVQRLTIEGNEIVSDGVKEAIYLTSVHGETGRDVTVRSNNIRGPTNKGIVIRTMDEVTVTNNVIDGSVIYEAEIPGQAIKGFRLQDNIIRDPTMCLRLLGRDNGVSDVLVDGNRCYAPAFQDVRGDVQDVTLGVNW